MNTLVWTIIACLLNGLIALIGVFTLYLKEKWINKTILVLVAFSTGALLGGAFFHLLEESLEKLNSFNAFLYLILGFILFLLIEKFLHWHHCHKKICKIHPFSYLILFGDSIHNFIDGMVIAASFLVNIKFGVITTLLIIVHEIPQELGDFAILVYGGFSKSKALFYNFISQLSCVLGGLIGYLFSSKFSIYLLPFAAGGFLYISATDLIPELRKETNIKKLLFLFSFFIIGLIFVIAIKMLLD